MQGCHIVIGKSVQTRLLEERPGESVALYLGPMEQREVRGGGLGPPECLGLLS